METRSLTIRCLQAREPGIWLCNSLESRGLRPWGSSGLTPSLKGCCYKSQSLTQYPRAGEHRYLRSKKERICPSSVLLSYWALSRLDDVHPLWWEPSPVLSLLIPLLISFGDTLTDTPRNNVLPVTWASLSPLKLTQKSNYRRLGVSKLLQQDHM